jgi:glycosyltransferase involved in cell wall biosynthesis
MDTTINDFAPLVSICIPTYEAKGKGVDLLSTNIASCLEQTYNNFEIIISDHSVDNQIKDLCYSVSDKRIKYIKNQNNRGSSTYNTNNAILHASGNYIKVINQDDFLLQKDTLEKAIFLINKGYKWVIFPCLDYDVDTSLNTKELHPIKEHYPRHPIDTKNLLLGINSIGSPSCSLFPKGFFFDPNITYMIDCELYYKLYTTLGTPGILKELSIGNGIGNHQLTAQLQNKYQEMMKFDIEYCFKKHLNIKD